jgi:hypothetical protein
MREIRLSGSRSFGAVAEFSARFQFRFFAPACAILLHFWGHGARFTAHARQRYAVGFCAKSYMA